MHIPKRENAPLKPSANENAPKKKLINQVRIGSAKVKSPTRPQHHPVHDSQAKKKNHNAPKRRGTTRTLNHER
jgi:hypothetical protein